MGWDAYRAVNPQGLVPTLDVDGKQFAQSTAILEFLEETYPENPLLPADEPQRSGVRAFCNLIACDIHPLNNLRVQRYVSSELKASEQAAADWYLHWVHEGFNSLETLSGDGPYVFGNFPTLADVLLVPQMYNARRFDVPIDQFPKLVRIVDTCNELPAFKKAAPELQPDAA